MHSKFHIVVNNSHRIRINTQTNRHYIGPYTSNATQPLSRSTKHQIHLQFSSLLQSDPNKFIKNYVHTPIVDELLPFVALPLCRVPLIFVLIIKEELDRMVGVGVFKQFDTADIINNLVVAHKSNGAIRICVDLTFVNMAIVPDSYLLYTIDELAELFAG